MLNFDVDPAVVRPLVPAGTELDAWHGRTFLSLVGFRFLGTRVLGVAVPLHRDFEEVNLRFYVRRKASDGWRRAVVFVRELVPRAAIALLARVVYGEHYTAVPMHHRIDVADGAREVAYRWRFGGRPYEIRVAARGQAQEIAAGTEAEFITEHYWGYARQRNGSTLEYRVEHPRWRAWTATDARIEGDLVRLYGERFGECLRASPASAFVAEGSEVKVLRATRLPAMVEA